MQRQASNESLGAARRDTLKEETAEALLEKLQKKGKNVKIVTEEEEQDQAEKVAKQQEEMQTL